MRITRHVRANVVGYVALFVALGGTGAWAADKITSKEIAKKAVRSKHIKKNAVKAPKIKENAVKTPKIAGGAVNADKLAEGSVGTAKIAGGAVTAGKIRDGDVRGDDIADQALQARHLGPGVFSSGHIELLGQGSAARWTIAPDAIGARELGDVIVRGFVGITVRSNTPGDGQYRMRKVTAQCPPGTQVISGGADWIPDVGAEDEMVIAEIDVDPATNSVEVTAGHDLNEDRNLFARALCLR